MVFTTLPMLLAVTEMFELFKLLTDVRPVTPVKSIEAALGEDVKFNTSMPTKEVADCVGAVPEMVTLNVSVPAPPLMTSPAFNVPVAPVKVSSPAVPVSALTAVVNVKAAFTAVELTAAYVPVAVPAVKDKTCEAADLVLNVVAEAPNVTSAVMLE